MQQVTAAYVPDPRVVEIVSEAEVELGVQGVSEKEFGDEPARFELGSETTKPGFIGGIGCAHCELVAELFGEFAFEADSGLVIHRFVGMDEAEALPEFIGGEPLHAD